MANRALILYASSTGNTEKVALIFRDVLTEYGWVPDLVHLDEDTDLPGQGIYLDHYDLVLLGSPVISGSPSPLVSRHLALVDVDPPRLYRSFRARCSSRSVLRWASYLSPTPAKPLALPRRFPRWSWSPCI